MTVTPQPESFQPDLYDYDFENDPVPTLNRLRAEDPVHWSRHGFWYLTRYDHVSAGLKDAERFFSAAAGWRAVRTASYSRKPSKASAALWPIRSTRWMRPITHASAGSFRRPSRAGPW